MSEQDVVDYVRKCTTVLLHEMRYIELRMKRIELYINRERNILGMDTKHWREDMKDLHEFLIEVQHDLDKMTAEFHEARERLLGQE